ncbi:MAG TPA: hypothetical protein VH917_05980, partial [Ignavibacteriaceae bacterium]
QFQEGDEAVLVLNSLPDDEVQLTSDLIQFEKKLNDTEVSYISSDLNRSFIKAAEIISASKNFNKEIYLLTDFQKSRLADDSQITDLGELLDQNVRLYSFDLSGKEVSNAGISNIKVNTQIFEKDKPVEYEIEIRNFSERSISNLVVSLFAGGERAAQQSVNLEPGEVKNINMESQLKSTGMIEVFAEIEEDDVLQDNRRYTSVFVPEQINVLLLSDKNETAKFVELALLSGGADEQIKLTAYLASRLPAISLNNFDVIIFTGNSTNDQSAKLKEFLNRGKGIIIFPGEDQTPETYSAFLNSLEIRSSFTLISETSPGKYFEFDEVDFNHPLFRNIFLQQEKKQIESPQIYSYFNLKTEGRGRNIISLIDGTAFLSEFRSSKGKVLVFAVSPVLKWSDFPLKSIFAPLINKSVFYLSAADGNERDFLAGENIYVNMSERISPQLRVIRPADDEELININEQSGSEFFGYERSDIPGTYRFLSGEKLLSHFNINVNPLESDLKYLSDEEFDDYLEKNNFQGLHLRIEKDEDPLQTILQARFGSELWRYFLLAALLIALIEMTIARSAKKELIGVQSGA